MDQGSPGTSQLSEPWFLRPVSAPPADADSWSGCGRAADVSAPHIHRQLKGRHTLQLREGAHQRHLLIPSEALQACDHYDCHCYFYPNHTRTASLKSQQQVHQQVRLCSRESLRLQPHPCSWTHSREARCLHLSGLERPGWTWTQPGGTHWAGTSTLRQCRRCLYFFCF